MIAIIFLLFLIAGFLIVDSIIDYLFFAVYALAATAIINNLIHLYKYYNKYNAIDRHDISNSLWFLLIGIGAAIVHAIWL